MILHRPSWSGFMSKVHRRTSSVQHICCPPTTIREHGPKQAIDNLHMYWQRNNARNEDCIASLSTLTFHLKRQDRWFWLTGNLLSFQASTFGSEDFTTCFRPWVRSVLLCTEMVLMPLAYMHVHSSFERDNNMQRTVLFT